MTAIPDRTTIDGPLKINYEPCEAERNNQEKINLERQWCKLKVKCFKYKYIGDMCYKNVPKMPKSKTTPP